MFLFVLLAFNLLQVSARATPACDTAQFQQFLRQLTDSVPKTAAEFEKRERLFAEQLKKLTDEELYQKVDAYIRHQLETQPYLPGLTPTWQAKNVQELIADFRTNVKNPSRSQLRNYSTNVATSAHMVRGMVINGRGELPPHLLKLYSKNMPEAMTLEELEVRLSHSK